MDEALRLAITHARKAVELDPGDANAQAQLATTLSTGDLENAMPIARQALAINPNCARAYWAIGTILIGLGRTAEGREALSVFER